MSAIFEIIMIISFGASWPMNLINSFKTKTSKGKSLSFYYIIFFGYIAGIISKILANKFLTLPSIFYIINLLMVGACIAIYYYNKKIYDKE